MMRSRRNVGRLHLNCGYGCCPSTDKRGQRRSIKRMETREWKREVTRETA